MRNTRYVSRANGTNTNEKRHSFLSQSEILQNQNFKNRKINE